MENTAKPVVEVIVEKNPVQITNSLSNFMVAQVNGYEGGCPIGVGVTPEEAISDFISTWQLKYDEQISVKVIETKIV